MGSKELIETDLRSTCLKTGSEKNVVLTSIPELVVYIFVTEDCPQQNLLCSKSTMGAPVKCLKSVYWSSDNKNKNDVDFFSVVIVNFIPFRLNSPLNSKAF